MSLNKDTFQFFAPVNLIKGTDKSGKKKMRLGGIASTSSEDADGEFLDPKGFELDYFLKYGFMNWNHQTNKDPLSLIGKPIDAVNKAEGLHLECELFENSPKAKEVYQLAEILEAQGQQLGFSIEGKVIERDKKNPKIVKKAKITGCAITPNPKNRDSVAEIIKGQNFESLSAYEKEDEETKEKALTAGSASGKAISKESLDGDIKELTENKDKKKKLTKSEVMAQLTEAHPELALEITEEFFTLIENIEKSIIMETPEIKISPEAISKAYETLGLKKGETTAAPKTEEKKEEPVVEETEIEKGYKEVSKTMNEKDPKKMTKEEKDKFKKSLGDLLKKMEEEEKEEEKPVEKAITAEVIVDAVSIVKAAGFEVVVKGEKPIEKAETQEDLSKKAEKVEPTTDINALIKGELDRIGKESDAKFEAQTTLIKSFIEEIGELRQTIEEIGNNSNGPKSVIKANQIEKSWDNELEKSIPGADKGGKKLSVSRDKTKILNMLEETYFQKGELVDNKLANETMAYESAGQISKGIIDTMKEKGYELIG